MGAADGDGDGMLNDVAGTGDPVGVGLACEGVAQPARASAESAAMVPILCRYTTTTSGTAGAKSAQPAPDATGEQRGRVRSAMGSVRYVACRTDGVTGREHHVRP